MNFSFFLEIKFTFKCTELSLMYKLLQRVKGGCESLMKEVCAHIEREGKKILDSETENKDKKNKEFYINYVDSLLKMKYKYDKV